MNKNLEIKLPKVLIIDDEPANCLVLEKVLGNLDCEISTVNRGWAGIELCEKESFALILLDILMPELNGYETLVRLKNTELNKNTPVFFMTGMETDQQLIVKSYKAGAIDFIQKPVNLSVLSRKVHFFVESYKRKEELRQSRQQMEAYLNNRLKIVAHLTHELRTPLFGMLGMIDALKQQPSTDFQTQLLQKIEINSENLLDTVNEFLDFTKFETEDQEMHYEYFSLKKSCEDIMTIMSYQFQSARQIKLKFSYDKTLSDFVRADKKKIRHVLMNLFSNAIKFTKEGHVKLEVKKVGLRQGSDLIKFIVSDTGIGIPEEKQQDIFEAFNQVDSELQDNAVGTGLGLSICTKLVGRLGGKLKLHSQVGIGTRFYFAIPIESGKESDLEDIKESYTLEELLGEKQLRVLIVDDVPDNLFVLKNYLNTNKIRLDLCLDSLVVNDMIRKNHYDIILLDLNMPEKSGFEIAEEFNQDLVSHKVQAHTKLIALTAFENGEELKERLKKLNFHDHILKPIRKESLYKKIVATALNINHEEDIKISDVQVTEKQKDVDFEGLDQDFLDYMPNYIRNKLDEIENMIISIEEDDATDASAYCHKILGTAKSFGLNRVNEDIELVQSLIKQDLVKYKAKVLKITKSVRNHLNSLLLSLTK